MVIRSFADARTEKLWLRRPVRRIDGSVARVALRKLLILDAAENLNDLRIRPGNKLEKLKGDRAGQHSIRVNQQFRLCFVWSEAGPENVELVDYH